MSTGKCLKCILLNSFKITILVSFVFMTKFQHRLLMKYGVSCFQLFKSKIKQPHGFGSLIRKKLVVAEDISQAWIQAQKKKNLSLMMISKCTHQKPKSISIDLSKASTLQTKSLQIEILGTEFIFNHGYNFHSFFKLLRPIMHFFVCFCQTLSFVIISCLPLISLLVRTINSSLQTETVANLSLLLLCSKTQQAHYPVVSSSYIACTT